MLTWRIYLFIDIGDILVVTHGSFNDHSELLDEVFNMLINMWMQVYPKKRDCFKDEVEYLGYIINKKGISP